MTNPIELDERRKAKESESRITTKQAVESLRMIAESLESEEYADTTARLYIISVITDDNRSIEGLGINSGDELEALGLLARWSHMVNYIYDDKEDS